MAGIGVVATLTVAEGKNSEFEAVFATLAEQVKANEPGAIFYSLHRSKADSQVYKVLEQYTDAEALTLHAQTEYYKAAGAQMAGLLAAAPEIELLDAV